jgi:hypothetical protein
MRGRCEGERTPPPVIGQRARLAGPVALPNRQTQSTTAAAAATAVHHRSVSWMPRANSGSDRTRKALSVQLSQQLGSKNGSRNRARPIAETAASR